MPLGDEWPDMARDVIGGDVRVTFPIRAAQHRGGTLMLRSWATLLRAVANDLEVLSDRRDIDEKTCLFYAKWKLRDLSAKLAKRTMR